MQVNELRGLLVNRKEKYMKTEAVVTKLEQEVEETNKRIQNIQTKLEKTAISLKQVRYSVRSLNLYRTFVGNIQTFDFKG